MDITRALQAAVRGYPHGTASIAAAMDITPTTLSHKISPTYEPQFCSPEEMLKIMEITGNDGPLIALAGARNYVLLPAPLASAGGDEELVQHMRRSYEEFSQFVSEVLKDTKDARVSAAELAKIQKEGAEAIAAIQRTIAWCGAKHESGKPAHLRSVA